MTWYLPFAAQRFCKNLQSSMERMYELSDHNIARNFFAKSSFAKNPAELARLICSDLKVQDPVQVKPVLVGDDPVMQLEGLGALDFVTELRDRFPEPMKIFGRMGGAISNFFEAFTYERMAAYGALKHNEISEWFPRFINCLLKEMYKQIKNPTKIMIIFVTLLEDLDHKLRIAFADDFLKDIHDIASEVWRPTPESEVN